MVKWIMVILLLLTMTVAVGQAQSIEANVLQQTDHRLYFSAGRESGLRAGSRFALRCRGLDVLTGRLEYVGPSVSWTRQLAALDTFVWSDTCAVYLFPAVVDSSATVTIGTTIPLSLYDPEHETLFLRSGDTVLPNLALSVQQYGNMVEVQLRDDILFSDSTAFDATSFVSWLKRLSLTSRSPLVRFFFSNLMPFDSNGVVVCANHCIKLYFRHAFPKAPVYLSRPEFGVFNNARKGTGPLMLAEENPLPQDRRTFVPNPRFRGSKPLLDTLVIRYFDERYQMRFAFDEAQIQAYIGFGAEDNLQGRYQARALYPFTAVLLPNTARPLGDNDQFVTSLYYCFDTDNTERYFEFGDAVPVNRWFEGTQSSQNADRIFPYNPKKGKQLYSILKLQQPKLAIDCTEPFLDGAVRYLADIAAQEGMSCDINPSSPQGTDIFIATLPSSDHVLPSALISAALALNDQRGIIMSDDSSPLEIWDRLSMGTRLDMQNRRVVFFERAEELLVEQSSFFPLFRPYLYAVGDDAIMGLAFDAYGFPHLADVRLLSVGNDQP
jgi:ABC-type transport system substrate-binding protein